MTLRNEGPATYSCVANPSIQLAFAGRALTEGFSSQLCRWASLAGASIVEKTGETRLSRYHVERTLDFMKLSAALSSCERMRMGN